MRKHYLCASDIKFNRVLAASINHDQELNIQGIELVNSFDKASDFNNIQEAKKAREVIESLYPGISLFLLTLCV